MDALSEALVSVNMTGAIFFRAECSSPWGFSVPPLAVYAHRLAPGSERLVAYHLITEGRAIIRLSDLELPLSAGDLVIIPHGDAHLLANGRSPVIVSAESSLDDILSGNLSTLRIGAGGEVTGIVCGYFGCDRRAERLFLNGLPQVIRISVRENPSGRWIEDSIRHLLGEAGLDNPGRSILLSKMAEALFIEALRQYTAGLPPQQTGWLAAARDPIVGAAIAAIHKQPERRWNIDDLAASSATSRSVLTERFARYLGQPPLAYLTMWRLQLASRHLLGSRDTVLQIALSVGYESESAFIRAFKREFGEPPARYRKLSSAAATRESPLSPTDPAKRFVRF